MNGWRKSIRSPAWNVLTITSSVYNTNNNWRLLSKDGCIVRWHLQRCGILKCYPCYLPLKASNIKFIVIFCACYGGVNLVNFRASDVNCQVLVVTFAMVHFHVSLCLPMHSLLYHTIWNNVFLHGMETWHAGMEGEGAGKGQAPLMLWQICTITLYILRNIAVISVIWSPSSNKITLYRLFGPPHP